MSDWLTAWEEEKEAQEEELLCLRKESENISEDKKEADADDR